MLERFHLATNLRYTLNRLAYNNIDVIFDNFLIVPIAELPSFLFCFLETLFDLSYQIENLSQIIRESQAGLDTGSMF